MRRGERSPMVLKGGKEEEREEDGDETEAQRPGDRARDRIIRGLASLTLVHGRWYVESFVGIGHSVSNATQPFYPAGREMSPRSDFSSSDTDLS